MQSDFDRARELFEIAHSDVDELGDDYSNEECNFLVGAQMTAMDALFMTPAPDFAALVHKMKVYAAEECFDMNRASELFATLIADVKRLAEEKAR